MKPLKPKQRRARIRETYREAHLQARREALDPGLRDVYEEIVRAPIRIVTCPLGKSVNHGGILRLAEAYRIEQVDFSPELDGKTDSSGGMGAHFWQQMRWIDAAEAITEAKEEGYQVFGLTISEDAVALQDVEWEFPAVIVLGEEKAGISPDVEEMCDVKVGIPLYGMVGSINVGQAAAIAINTAVTAYADQCPEFQPVRNVSRKLLGLETVNYSQDSEDQQETTESDE